MSGEQPPNLRAWRRSAGLTLAEVARMSGVPPTTVRNTEVGTASEQACQKVADALHSHAGPPPSPGGPGGSVDDDGRSVAAQELADRLDVSPDRNRNHAAWREQLNDRARTQGATWATEQEQACRSN